MRKDKTEIRKIGIESLEELRYVGRNSFYETFYEHNTSEDMDLYLEESFNPDRLKKELINKESFIYLIYREEKPAGYLKLNIGSAQTENFGDSFMEVERLYILSEFQGLGLGRLLINKSEEMGQVLNMKTLWLGVWENNERAINFYSNLGFKKFSEHVFLLGRDPQRDILMKRNIMLI